MELIFAATVMGVVLSAILLHCRRGMVRSEVSRRIEPDDIL